MARMLVLMTTLLVTCTLCGGRICGSLRAGEAPSSRFQPYNGAACVDPTGLSLSWESVTNAKSYSVYLGANRADLPLLGTVTEARLAVGAPLAQGRCYYWRVDTRTSSGVTIAGPLVRFTTAATPSGDPALLAWYGFDEATGETSQDLSGRGADAQLKQMIWEATGAPGLDGGSARSDGAGNVRFEVTAGARPLDQATLTGWFLIPQQEAPATLWALGSGAGSYVSLAPQPAGGGGPVIRIRAVSPSQPIETQARDPLPLDRWTHMAIVMDAEAEQVVVYEDGVVVLTARGLTRLASVLESATTVLLATSFTSNVCLRCSMDDVRLYGRALGADEIARTLLGHPDSPYEPEPRHWAQVHTSAPPVLRWEADGALAYNVYAGRDVNNLDLVGIDLMEPECRLAQKFADGQTLCWQVEAAVDGGFIRSPLWRFSVTSRSLEDIVENARPWWADYTDSYGQIAPDFSLTDMDGRGHRLRDYRGRHLVVVLWAPWCSVCRDEMATLSQLREAMSEDEMDLLAVTDESNRSTMPDFLAAHPEINFPVCITRVPALPGVFGNAFHFPSIFYIAPDGTMKLGTVGEVPLNTMTLILDAAWPYAP